VFALPSWLIVPETTSEGTLPDSQTFLSLNRESLKAENIKWKYKVEVRGFIKFFKKGI